MSFLVISIEYFLDNIGYIVVTQIKTDNILFGPIFIIIKISCQGLPNIGGLFNRQTPKFTHISSPLTEKIQFSSLNSIARVIYESINRLDRRYSISNENTQKLMDNILRLSRSYAQQYHT